MTTTLSCYSVHFSCVLRSRRNPVPSVEERITAVRRGRSPHFDHFYHGDVPAHRAASDYRAATDRLSSPDNLIPEGCPHVFS